MDKAGNWLDSKNSLPPGVVEMLKPRLRTVRAMNDDDGKRVTNYEVTYRFKIHPVPQPQKM